MIHLPVLFTHGDHLLNVEEVAAITARDTERPLTAVELMDGRRRPPRKGTVTVTLRSGREFERHGTTREDVLAAMQEAAQTAADAVSRADKNDYPSIPTPIRPVEAP